MANKTITMLQIRRVLQLLNQGVSQRKISKAVGISRNTVQDYCEKISATGISVTKLLSLDDHALNQTIRTKKPVDLKDARYEELAPDLAHYQLELLRTGVTRLQTSMFTIVPMLSVRIKSQLFMSLKAWKKQAEVELLDIWK